VGSLQDARRQLAQIHGLDGDRVLTFREWCALNSLSERVGWRVLHGPDGPTITRLSQRRLGITVGNNRAWQKRREV
jgi:hypothetical protein